MDCSSPACRWLRDLTTSETAQGRAWWVFEAPTYSAPRHAGYGIPLGGPYFAWCCYVMYCFPSFTWSRSGRCSPMACISSFRWCHFATLARYLPCRQGVELSEFRLAVWWMLSASLFWVACGPVDGSTTKNRPEQASPTCRVVLCFDARVSVAVLFTSGVDPMGHAQGVALVGISVAQSIR